MAEGGVVAKGDDGSVYFIRDEVLAACKVEGDELNELSELADGSEVEGFALNVGQASGVQFVGALPSTYLVTRNPGYKVPDISSYSTVMCPW